MIQYLRLFLKQEVLDKPYFNVGFDVFGHLLMQLLHWANNIILDEVLIGKSVILII